jgi:hypothetical protein
VSFQLMGAGTVSRRWKIGIIVAAVAGIASTPLIWLLGNTDAGQLAGASIQAAAGIIALVLAMLQRSAPVVPGQADMANETGHAKAAAGGAANTGVRRNGPESSRSAWAAKTGNAAADGTGSSANTGIYRT